MRRLVISAIVLSLGATAFTFAASDNVEAPAPALPSPQQSPETQTVPVQQVAPQKSTPSIQQQQNCHPSYSSCLRADASDYDCAGGSGNGPYYTGTVRVIGPDVFGLDRDNDGWGCE